MTGRPLEAIRAAELAAARKIEQAATDATRSRAQARLRAEHLIDQARRAGDAEADRRYRRALQDAHAEAERIGAEAEEAALRLRELARPHLDRLVEAMTAVVLGTDRDDEKGRKRCWSR